MKTYKPGVVESITAAAALAAMRFIGFDGNLCGADAKALGASELATNSGEQCPVIVSGIALVESGGVITAGAALASDATGRAVAATALSATTPIGATPVTSTSATPAMTIAGGYMPQALNGRALDAASGAGEFIRVLLGAA